MAARVDVVKDQTGGDLSGTGLLDQIEAKPVRALLLLSLCDAKFVAAKVSDEHVSGSVC